MWRGPVSVMREAAVIIFLWLEMYETNLNSNNGVLKIFVSFGVPETGKDSIFSDRNKTTLITLCNWKATVGDVYSFFFWGVERLHLYFLEPSDDDD